MTFRFRWENKKNSVMGTLRGVARAMWIIIILTNFSLHPSYRAFECQIYDWFGTSDCLYFKGDKAHKGIWSNLSHFFWPKKWIWLSLKRVNFLKFVHASPSTSTLTSSYLLVCYDWNSFVSFCANWWICPLQMGYSTHACNSSTSKSWKEMQRSRRSKA